MSAKRSLSMSRSILLILGAALCAQPLLGQEAWREGRNVAGVAVTAPETGQEAEAELSGTFTSGDFRSPSMGKTVWSTGVSAQSESRFKNLYLSGNFGFELETGYGMMGSMFTDPGYYPIDVLEFTPGTKTRQNYDIGGAFAWKNASRWTPGASARFRGVNYAKRKDLRHTTWREELEVVPSVVYSAPEWRLGASVLFEKTSEFIVAEQIGVAPQNPYMAFLDKGMRYGVMQVWDGSGIHLKEPGVDRLPVKEYAWGFALQASFMDRLYADFEWQWTRGEVGEKGYTWFRFPGQEIKASFSWDLPSDKGHHHLGLGYEWVGRENHEIVLEKVTEGGVTTPVEYGSNRIYMSREFDISPSWSFVSKTGWMLGTTAHLLQTRERSTILYPFLDYDEATLLRWNVMGAVPVGPFVIRAGAHLGFKVGERAHIVDIADDGTTISDSITRLEDWWDRETEASDLTRIGLNVALRYPFSPGGRVPLYVEASCNWIHAFGVVLLSGPDRQTTTLKLGYNF